MRPNIGEFLSALRRSKGLTQQEVADRLGVSNKTVSSWETGASYPDISMLSSIAALLIGCVALESLIGFFVGLIFLLAGTLLCVIQYKYLRCQLTQNDFASDAVQAFL